MVPAVSDGGGEGGGVVGGGVGGVSFAMVIAGVLSCCLRALWHSKQQRYRQTLSPVQYLA